MKAYELLKTDRLQVRLVTQGGIERVVASGECPYCSDDVAFDLVQDVALPSPGGRSTKGFDGVAGDPSVRPPDFVTVDVACHCNAVHPGRPESITRGCGIVFRARVRPAVPA